MKYIATKLIHQYKVCHNELGKVNIIQN